MDVGYTRHICIVALPVAERNKVIFIGPTEQKLATVQRQNIKNYMNI